MISRNDIIYRCECGGSHFISMAAWPKDDYGNEEEYFLQFEHDTLCYSLWDRIKNAFHVLRYGQTCRWGTPEVLLNSVQARKFANEILETIASNNE